MLFGIEVNFDNKGRTESDRDSFYIATCVSCTVSGAFAKQPHAVTPLHFTSKLYVPEPTPIT